jgi:AraC-like DNA-binding protein
MARLPQYREWLPRPELARFVVCTWAGQFGDEGEPYADRILPDGCIDIVWAGGRVTVAGPDTTSILVAPRRGARFAGLRFRPGLAPSMLGVPASELLDARVDASEVLGSRASALVDRLAGACSLRAVARELETSVVEWLPHARAPDGLVEAAAHALRQSSTAKPVAALARQLGVDERRLLRRFVAEVGYGPKMLHRVLRLQRFIALGARPPPRALADLALNAGYADQAHLTRECQELARSTPSRLVGYLVTSG